MKKKNFVLFLILMIIFSTNTLVHASNGCPFSPELIEEVNEVFRIIQIAAPIVLLLLTSFDFAKVVFSDSKDGMDKAKTNFLKRAVAVLIIFFAPMIITLIFELVDQSSGCLSEFLG